MAVVYFKRKEKSTTTLNNPTIIGMKSDTSTLYFLTSTLSADSDYPQSYLFYAGRSIAASPDYKYPLRATLDSTNRNFELDAPYSSELTIGLTINVRFASTNTSSAPTLHSVKICRRLSNSLTPITIAESELKTDTSYRLVYTKIGTIYYWVISGEKPAWSDLYGTPSNLLKYSVITDTSSIGTDANTAYLILE